MNPLAQKRRRFLLIVLCFFAFFGVALLWILNSEGIVTGPWATVLSVLCTILSVVFAFLQWQDPFSHRFVPVKMPSTSALTQSGLFNMPDSFGVNKRRGALIVKGQKKDLGITIHLCSGFTSTPITTDLAANITERESGTGSVFVALFPALKSGNYTIFSQTLPCYAFITVYAGQIASMDWRKGGNHGYSLH